MIGMLKLIWVAFILSLIGFTVYGMVLAFQASIVLGALALLLEPAPFIIGVVSFFSGTDLAATVAKMLGWN